MNMFDPFIKDWCGELVWTAKELKKLNKLLQSISYSNGGVLAEDLKLEDHLVLSHQVTCANDALSRRVTNYAAVLKDNLMNPVFALPVDEPQPHTLPCLVDHRWVEKVNVNSDDLEVLSKLSGVGRGTAKRIVDYRMTNGDFTDLKQLTSIKGISDNTVDGFKDQAYCRKTERITFMNEELADFIKDPTFSKYVKLIVSTKGSFSWTTKNKGDSKAQIFEELERTLDDVKANPYSQYEHLGYTRFSKVKATETRNSKAMKVAEKGTDNVSCGALLYDGQYLPFLTELLKKAKTSIYLMMFFLRYESEEKYVANELVDMLVKANKKGLDVKVILDRDAEGDVIGSRFINEEVFTKLRKHGVPVIYDREERMTHSKLLVVDDLHVVVGSHNWTGGSFLSYDDTSVYIESAELAYSYKAILFDYWEEYVPLNSMPKPQRVKCIEESATGRNMKFIDTVTQEEMLLGEFIKAIEEGKYDEYHIRKINGLKVPVSNPNYTLTDNLS